MKTFATSLRTVALLGVLLALAVGSAQALENRKVLQAPGPPGPQAAPPQTAPPLPPGNVGLLPRFLRGEQGLVLNSPIDPAHFITPLQSVGLYVGRVGPGAYGSL
mmetsp:Transcript_5160/g.18106  ORF Transcript_5160/g.18106 Transcript_5160/m.18106 type:complete len:105 (+) Transcript_5160:174-488(+)